MEVKTQSGGDFIRKGSEDFNVGCQVVAADVVLVDQLKCVNLPEVVLTKSLR